jgi:predicted unusual protein kinase regulating ubiquinone biosynthesis (AarF/ABC1/UbiB family)
MKKVKTKPFSFKTQFSQTVDSSRKLVKILKFGGQFQYLNLAKKATPEELGIFTRENLAYLGSTFIKIGQLLSTRSDIFDKDFTAQLTSLQDNVPPFDISMYLEDLDKIVSEFEQTPIASASIGQVHKAVLKSGETVAVKLKRPGIDREIDSDFQMLLGLIGILRNVSDRREFYELETVFKQYQILLNEEIDFTREVQNMDTFKQMFESNDEMKWIKIPQSYANVSSNDIIVMEYLPAIKINDIETLDKLNFDKSRIAEKLVECYIKQIVDYGKVHIDPHPGNVGITTSGKIVFYDYGMVTDISPTLRGRFQELLVAVSEKDTDSIAKLLVAADIVTIEPENMVYLKSFVLSFLNYIEKIDIAYFKENFIDKISNDSLPFIINSNFLLILRGLTILEGVCKSLDDNFSYKRVIDPYITQSFPIDIIYLEKRARKDIGNLQKLSFTQVMTEGQKNDVDRELLEKKLKDMTIARDKDQSRQFISNIVGIAVLLALGYGDNLIDNLFLQIGVVCVSFLNLYNK